MSYWERHSASGCIFKSVLFGLILVIIFMADTDPHSQEQAYVSGVSPLAQTLHIAIHKKLFIPAAGVV